MAIHNNYMEIIIMADKGGLLSVLNNIKVDANELLEKLTKELKNIDERDTNAVVYNASQEDVEFYCYNDSDQLRWIPARNPRCPSGSITYLNKGLISWGPTIQVFVKTDSKPDKVGPFFVVRHSATIWDGRKFCTKENLENELKMAASKKTSEEVGVN